MRPGFFCLPLLLVGMSSAALAQQTPPEGLQPIEDGAPTLVSAGDAEFEPEVTIRREGGTQYREFRIGGRLYKIQVIPSIGFPYYLIDMLGHGEWTRIDSNNAQLIVPQWVIFRF